MVTLKIIKDKMNEHDWREARAELGTSITAFGCKGAFLFLDTNDDTLEKSVKAIEWLINHGYISIER